MSTSAVRAQSLGEEVANAVNHGAGFLMAVASLPVLVHHAMAHGDAATVVGASLFSATMIALYLVSTLYHALPPGAAKRCFNRLDHAAIYLFIAGGYVAMGWFAVIAAAPLLERLPGQSLA